MNSKGWKTYRLGELILSANTGLDAIKRAPIVSNDTGIKCLRIQDVSQEKDFFNWGFCEVTKQNYEKFQLKKDDLIIARTGETVGVNRLIKSDLVSVFNNGLIRLRTDNTKLQPLFLYYSFQSKIFNNHIHSIAKGTSTQPNMRIEALLDFNFDLPELTIQNKISSILSSLDNKIELNEQTNKTLEEIAKTIFKEWFLDFNFPNSDGRKKHSEFGEIPAEWNVDGIGEISFVQNGYAFKSNDFKEEGEVGILKIKNINGNVVDIEATDFVDASVVERLDRKFKVETGAMLIAMTGAQVGKVGLVPLTERQLWLNQRVGMFREKIPHGNLFMYLLLTTDIYQKAIQNSALGSAQPNISASAIESIRAIIPQAELIVKFGETIKPMFEKILDNLAENETLKSTRDNLLPKLMSGEIEIPNS